MADMLVVEELQAYLVAQGVGTLPTPAGSASDTIPSIWLQPRDGAPVGRNVRKEGGKWIGETTITIVDTLLLGAAALEAWIEEAFVDIIVRSPSASTAKLTQRTIKGLLVPNDSHGGRKMWTMNNLLVEYSTEWRGDQPLPQRQSVADSDPHLTYDRVASYRFGCRRKALAGQPYVP